MGMCLAMCTISPRALEAVLADPPLVWRVIAPDDPEAYETARSEKRGLLGRLFSPPPANREPELDPPEEVEHTDLDKAWHGIHYLLTGEAGAGEGARAYLLAGGRQIGTVEVGYGPARALAATEVADWDRALATVTTEELRRRFDPREMMALEIYPTIWDRDPAEEDTLGYCLEFFETLRAFVARAAASGRGVIVYVT